MPATAHASRDQLWLLRRQEPPALAAPAPAISKPVLLPDPPPIEPGECDAVTQLRASLERSIAAKLSNGSELIASLARRRRTELLPTTLTPFDDLLGGGLARGKMTEVCGRLPRFSIVMAAMAATTSIGETAALIDLGDHFDPALAEAAGVDLRRVLWIRPATLKQAVTAAEMLGATGFQLVIVDAGLHPIRGRRVPDAAWVRLARMAEAQGTALVVSAPYPLSGTASEAVVRGSIGRVQWRGGGDAPRVLYGIEVRLTLEKHRHIRPGHNATLALLTEEALRAGNVAEAKHNGSVQEIGVRSQVRTFNEVVHAAAG